MPPISTPQKTKPTPKLTPETRYIWDKENFDPKIKQFTPTLQSKKNKRQPLRDITSPYRKSTDEWKVTDISKKSKEKVLADKENIDPASKVEKKTVTKKKKGLRI